MSNQCIATGLSLVGDSYTEFIATKGAIPAGDGLWPLEMPISPILYPFQAQLVEWALRRGRAALFCDTGLGKTLMQLEWARHIPGQVLIAAPLAVAQQTVREAAKLHLPIQYVRHQDEISGRISITNYEMLDHIDPRQFRGIILDESSILKSITGKTRQKLIDMFQRSDYRLACTATPAPNDIAEFANHAEFLGIATRQEMLSMFFAHDDAGWRLKGYAQEGFFRWMSTWAMMVKMPSDIGFSDDGFELPPLTTDPVWTVGDAQAAAEASGRLFITGLEGITGRAAARKATVAGKIEAALPILQADTEQWIVWHGLNEEGRRLHAQLPDSVLVEGKDSLDTKIKAINDFLEGRVRVLITKPSIAGFGLNLQACHNVMFLGLNDSWETYYQAIRRCWRFGQASPVTVKIVMSDLEQPILDNVLRKDRQAEEVSRRMVENINEHQRAALGLQAANTNGYHDDDDEGVDWRLMRGDCVLRLAELEPDSVDLSIFSPPFLSLYTYSDSAHDMGNSTSPEQFFEQFNYFVRALLRVTKPGRNVACHVSQVPAKLIVDGFIGLKDFRGAVINAFVDGGFIYHGEVVIDKDPQAQAIRTHAKGLLFAQLKRDASWLRPGLADYILVFRKPGDNLVPIHPDIDNNQWIEWARPIWYGIRESDTLHVAEARSEKDERHIAPLQLGVIERCVRLWSNPGELVLSPFAGIGSEGYQSLISGRRFVGIELKPEYYEVACRNLERAISRKTQVPMAL